MVHPTQFASQGVYIHMSEDEHCQSHHGWGGWDRQGQSAVGKKKKEQLSWERWGYMGLL